MRLGRPAVITDEQREELWRRYKTGETIPGIDVRDRRRFAAYCKHRRVAPAKDSPAEREAISRGMAAGNSFRVIASTLNRAVSTVSQEIARHGRRSDTAGGAAWAGSSLWARNLATGCLDVFRRCGC